MSADILAKLQNIVGLQLGIEAETVTPESSFTKELGADSLDVVELVMAIEEAFGVDIDDDAAGNIFTVQDVLDYIDENKQ